MRKNLILIVFIIQNIGYGWAQIPTQNEHLGNLFTTPKSYVAGYTSTPPPMEGDPDGEIWKLAEWSEVFEDIEGDLKPKPYYITQVKMLWDKDYLYVAATLRDKHIWAYLNERDQIVFYDNDFEVFIDPANSTHQYFEYEINAVNTIFDLFLPKPYRAASGALITWDSNRLKHKVEIYGTVNNPNDEDSGWTVKMAIPFADITIGNRPHIPVDNEVWRINFSRVQWQTDIIDGKYVKKKDANGKNLPEHNWVWSPQGAIDMHMPERWGYIQFSTKEPGQSLPEFKMPYSELQRQYLWLVYYKQHKYKKEKGTFAKSLDQLGIKTSQTVNGKTNNLSMESLLNQFSATITDNTTKPILINQEGYITNL